MGCGSDIVSIEVCFGVSWDVTEGGVAAAAVGVEFVARGVRLTSLASGFGLRVGLGLLVAGDVVANGDCGSFSGADGTPAGTVSGGGREALVGRGDEGGDGADFDSSPARGDAVGARGAAGGAGISFDLCSSFSVGSCSFSSATRK